METLEIQRNLQNLDARVKNLWNRISEVNNQISRYYSQAEQYTYLANHILNSILPDDDRDYSYKTAEAQSYYANADNCRLMARECEKELNSLKDELRSYNSQYEYYMQECNKNIEKLNITIEKLLNVPNSKYSSGVGTALSTAKQKLVFNKQFADGCVSRINSINQICGSAGTVVVRNLKLH